MHPDKKGPVQFSVKVTLNFCSDTKAEFLSNLATKLIVCKSKWSV